MLKSILWSLIAVNFTAFGCEPVATLTPFKNLDGIKIERAGTAPSQPYQLCEGDKVEQVGDINYTINYFDSIERISLNNNEETIVEESLKCGLFCKFTAVFSRATNSISEQRNAQYALTREQESKAGKIFVPYDFAEGPQVPFMVKPGRQSIRLSWLGTDSEYTVRLQQGDARVVRKTRAKFTLLDVSTFDRTRDIELTISADTNLQPYRKIIRFAEYDEAMPDSPRALLGYYLRMFEEHNWSVEILSELHENKSSELEVLRNNLETDANFINKLLLLYVP